MYSLDHTNYRSGTICWWSSCHTYYLCVYESLTSIAQSLPNVPDIFLFITSILTNFFPNCGSSVKGTSGNDLTKLGVGPRHLPHWAVVCLPAACQAPSTAAIRVPYLVIHVVFITFTSHWSNLFNSLLCYDVAAYSGPVCGMTRDPQHKHYTCRYNNIIVQNDLKFPWNVIGGCSSW